MIFEKEGKQFDGRRLLQAVKAELAPYKDSLRDLGKKVAIVYFEQPSNASDYLARAIQAAKVSTRAKVRTFRDVNNSPVKLLRNSDRGF